MPQSRIGPFCRALAMLSFAISAPLVAVAQTQSAQANDDGIPAATAPINCATAEGDIRALNGEKDYAKTHRLQEATALVPSGMLLGIVTGTESKKLQMLSPEYTKHIDARIAAIEAKCGIN